MDFKPWHFVAMEEYGFTTTNTGLINRVARYLADSPNNEIGPEEFRSACIACNVDPDLFTQEDLNILQHKLNELT